MNWHLFIGLLTLAFGTAGMTTMLIARLLIVLHKLGEEQYAYLMGSIRVALWSSVFATILGCVLIASTIP